MLKAYLSDGVGTVRLRPVTEKRTEILAEGFHSTAQLILEWEQPLIDIQYNWFPYCGMNRHLHTDWNGPEYSRIASSAPVYSFYNTAGRNRLTVALSDALICAAFTLGVREENGTLYCKISLPMSAAGVSSYRTELYRDEEDISFAAALRRVTDYWEKQCGYVPAAVPDAAKESMYSFWYSFHQDIFAPEVEAECARAAALGFKTVIVDDGWQTDNADRGYAWCGDWEPEKSKFPDMAAHVQRVHDLGLRYVLWYSVPFMGKHAKHFEQFRDMLLDPEYVERNGNGNLDPRYPEVRQYLIDVYVKALREWNLDGFKLDFIDCLTSSPEYPRPAKPGMDIPVLEHAVRRLMTDILTALQAIKPDILVEFRQRYIGPVMRTYGNMLRVGDCPADPISNRVGTVDLRLLSGKTAVHSDMLMWHKNETPEAAALQLISVIFAVLQFSVRLDTLNEEHRRLLRFWFDFKAEHRDLLLDTPLEVESPENLYPLVRAEREEEAAIAVYQAGMAARLGNQRVIYVLNGSFAEALILRGEGCYDYETRNCMGDPVEKGTLELSGIAEVKTPKCGILKLTRRL